MEAILGVKSLPEEEVYYRESDGKPMAETDLHRDLMVALIEALKGFFRGEPELYVSGSLFVYFRQGDPSACVAPDLFVVRGVSKRNRWSCRVWKAGKEPEVVIAAGAVRPLPSPSKTRRQGAKNPLPLRRPEGNFEL